MEILIQNFFVEIIGQHPFIATIILSMLPVIELKGALPFGISNVWVTPLTGIQSLMACVIGGMIISAIILSLLHILLPYIKSHDLYRSLVLKFSKKTATLSTQKSNSKKFLLLCLFTLIPLPLTGYYTSCVIAILCGLKPFYSWLFINLGNLISGILILILGLLSESILSVMLLISFGLFVIYSVYVLFCIISRFLKAQNS